MMQNKVQKSIVGILLLLIVISLVVLVFVVVSKGNDTPLETTEAMEPADTNEIKDMYKIDITPYREAIFIKDASFLALVNAKNSIGSTVPDNIVDSSQEDAYTFSSYKINQTALAALTAMCLEAKACGVEGIDLTSAYRSYDKQTALFYGYCDRERQKNPSLSQKEAEAIVEKYSCRPGTSEHQTGLAVDLRLKGDSNTLLEESFADTKAGKWLAENCARFGFVLRFPKSKTEVTGIQYEPWHFRFVGYDAANEMKEKGMCLEEYVAYLGGYERE